MSQNIPQTMRAATINQFGGVEALSLQTLPIPEMLPNQILLRIEAAGVGSWDSEEREGRYADFLGVPDFPYVLGWDAAGTVIAVGADVSGIKIGDRVYTAVVPGSNGGKLYAEYAALEAQFVWPVPQSLTITQAGVMGWDALTALTGLDQVLHLQAGESVMIFGASGGIGHIAVQLAKRMGARVFAVASGADGLAFAHRLGADVAINGRSEDVLAAARAFAPQGLDAALLTAGGEVAQRAPLALREGGRIAYPNGIARAPSALPGRELHSYDADRSPARIAQLHRLIEMGPFEIHIARAFSLAQTAQAHHELTTHYLGKLALIMP
jgi:NADPH:quinone reductase